MRAGKLWRQAAWSGLRSGSHEITGPDSGDRSRPRGYPDAAQMKPRSRDREGVPIALRAAKGEEDACVGQDVILRRVGNPPAALVRSPARPKRDRVPSGSEAVATVISEQTLGGGA
jgi:hypothetical protein